MQKDDQPAFTRISYAIEDYALIVPVSNDLMNDNTAGLMAYLSRWMGKKSVLTENINLLSLLGTLEGTALTSGKEIAGIKTALNTGLDPAISQTAALLTNQSGFNVLDLLTDSNGRPLLMPDPTKPTQMLLRGRPIVMLSDTYLPNDETNGAPLYIGDFSQFGTLFRAATMAVASTNVGGNSWNTNSTEVRAITRLDEMQTDSAAAVKRFIPLV